LNTSFYSNGKLLLTGEYLVLDGALSLAVPTRFGQSLVVKPIDEPKLIWKSLDENDTVWFEDEFVIKEKEILNQVQDDNEISRYSRNDNDVSERLIEILNVAKQLNPKFLTTTGFEVTTHLDFPKNWGLGTSSTLINNIANWANVDAYKLLELTFGGSGYDIACAQYNSAITYQLNNEILRYTQNDKMCEIKPVNFNPIFKEHLYFVYLNRKQNSREGIAQYKKNRNNLSLEISEVSDITKTMINCSSLSEFEKLIVNHEEIISKVLGEKTIKEKLFSGFNGSIKSLGAWNGDFVLVASNENPRSYFKNKGYETVIFYEDMVLNNSKK